MAPVFRQINCSRQTAATADRPPLSALGTCAVACAFLAQATVLLGAAPRASTDSYQERFIESQKNRPVLGTQRCDDCHTKNLGHVYTKPDGQTEKYAMEEYLLWKGADDKGAHYRAYIDGLNSDDGRRMAQVMARWEGKPDDPLHNDPTKRDDCLSCHAFGYEWLLDDAREPAQPWFEARIRDGVGCEACHGRAEYVEGNANEQPGWISVHADPPGWQNPISWHQAPADVWLKHGMYDTRELHRWAELCLRCHMGTWGREMTHTLMGAGHPDLSLEVATDSLKVPKHWRVQRYLLDGESVQSFYTRLWAVGQLVTLRESMRRLVTWMNDSSASPDFALFSCYDCHHEMLASPIYKIRALTGTSGGDRLPPGEPGADLRAWVVAKHVIAAMAPDKAPDAASAIEEIHAGLRLGRPDREKVAAAATKVMGIADSLIKPVEEHVFTWPEIRSLLRAIAQDTDGILAAGPLGAEQAYRAFWATCFTARSSAEVKANVTAELGGLIRKLGEMTLPGDESRASLSPLDPAKFRDVMKQLAAELKD